MSEENGKRYFVDARVGCVAVRDRERTDPDRQGLHPDMAGVVWYARGAQGKEGWEVRESRIEQAHLIAAAMNGSAASSPQPVAGGDGGVDPLDDGSRGSGIVPQVLRDVAEAVRKSGVTVVTASAPPSMRAGDAGSVEDILRAEVVRQRAALAAPPAGDAEIARLKRIIERDRTAYCNGINAITREIKSRRGMAESRGSYEWDDDRYRLEFGEALDAIKELADAAMRSAHACDLTDSPTTPAEVALARNPAVALNAGRVPPAGDAPTHVIRCIRCGGTYGGPAGDAGGPLVAIRAAIEKYEKCLQNSWLISDANVFYEEVKAAALASRGGEGEVFRAEIDRLRKVIEDAAVAPSDQWCEVQEMMLRSVSWPAPSPVDAKEARNA